jgi:hypothetical protein
MKCLGLGITALLLGGCKAIPGPTQTVSVAVPIVCQEAMPSKPIWPTDTLPYGSDVFVQNNAFKAEITLREGYEGKLEAALTACTSPLKK